MTTEMPSCSEGLRNTIDGLRKRLGTTAIRHRESGANAKMRLCLDAESRLCDMDRRLDDGGLDNEAVRRLERRLVNEEQSLMRFLAPG